MYSDGFAIKNTEFNYLYSNDFRLWIETACETYKKLNSCLGKVQNRQLISHTKVQDNLYKIIYEGNCIIYVNYNENSVEIDDLIVNGKDFIMIGGENQ
jgi:NOL1/NOP2/fmu family ribosome biogenesis protein